MKTILHKSETRGHANHGWLDTHHTFSFANYYNPERVHFGALRVLNDDRIDGGQGFGTHPHDNMEIISIPISGDLEHKDSMGNHGVITTGEIQVMSAGTGIFHSEYNKNKDKEAQFLQIWVFPNKKNVIPRYDQISLSEVEKIDELYQILSPNPAEQGVWIHQNAWFHLGDLSEGWEGEYELKDKSNGVYFFIIEGNVTIAGQALNRRDGLGVSETDSITIKTDSQTKLLVMEIPMTIN
ncbi:MAG: pirin family protein [Paludibacter sp.]|nr:pirin family protein [Paludibacter sp.]